MMKAEAQVKRESDRIIRRIGVNKRGFTLVEILIALVILSVGVLGIAVTHIMSIRGNSFGRYLTEASYTAQDRLEFLDVLSYDSPQLQPMDYDDGNVNIAGIVFSRSYRVVDDPNTGRRITYTVSWNDGVNRSVVFSTIRS
jgi:prepilin-type N-terminal cleavage/methylation domain-containing protein